MTKQNLPRDMSVFLRDMAGNAQLLTEVFDVFPLPIEVFAPDGTTVYINKAMMELNGILDAELIVGKYNLLHDPLIIDQMDLGEDIQKAFDGEAVIIPDFSAPIQNLVDRGVIKEKPFEAAVMDMYLSPVEANGRMAYVLGVFVVSRVYQEKPQIAKAKAYIDEHWRDDYDNGIVAKAAGISVSQLYSLFKEHIGMTPGDYHKQIKVSHIKEALADKNLTIAKAFAACGLNSRGTYARVFKEVAGMSPKEYRASVK